MSWLTMLGIGIGLLCAITAGVWIYLTFQFSHSSDTSSVGNGNTYTGWIYVNDFTKKYGLKRQIVSAGTGFTLSLDETPNGFIVEVVGVDDRSEQIKIDGISAKKWVHVAVSVQNKNVRVYINGTLKAFHTMKAVPKQTIGSLAFGSDWDGSTQGFAITNTIPSDEAIQKMAGSPPEGVSNYFSLSWYTQ